VKRRRKRRVRRRSEGVTINFKNLYAIYQSITSAHKYERATSLRGSVRLLREQPTLTNIDIESDGEISKCKKYFEKEKKEGR
jgi:hypothetical protein